MIYLLSLSTSPTILFFSSFLSLFCFEACMLDKQATSKTKTLDQQSPVCSC